jgi:hypothetical protein
VGDGDPMSELEDEELIGCGVGALVAAVLVVFTAITVVMWVLR